MAEKDANAAHKPDTSVLKNEPVPAPAEILLPAGKKIAPNTARGGQAAPRAPSGSPVPLSSPALLQSFSMPAGIELPEAPFINNEEAPATAVAPFSAKDIPVGEPTTPKTPPILRAMDMLNRGNAVLAAGESRARAAAAHRTSPPTRPETEKQPETPLERNLRESGLRAALPRQRAAPERAALPAADAPGALPRIHTYAEDMGREIQKRGATISSIVTAEKARRPREAERADIPAHRHPNMLIIAATILVIVSLGAIGGTVLYLTRTVEAPAVAQSVIPPNQRVAVAEDANQPLAQTLAQARSGATLDLGEVEEFDVEENGARLSAYGMLTALGAPNELARNATDVFVGVHAFDHTQPFIIVRVAAYDRAFRAMLDWENTIGDNLGAFFAPTSAGPEEGSARAPALSFSDAVIANLDVRESQSAWPILYAFPRRDLLIVTTNEGTLREVLTRLSLERG